MIYIKSKDLILRTILPKDLDFLYQVENDSNYFHLSDSYGPYTVTELKTYIVQTKASLSMAKQYRFVICLLDDTAIGFVDLFNYNEAKQDLGLGIIIYEKKYRKKGFAKKAIQLLKEYCFEHLAIKTIKASVLDDNKNSLLLFTQLGFKKMQTSIKWNSYLQEHRTLVHFTLNKNNN
jgi:diamine N-acetyltransferase